MSAHDTTPGHFLSTCSLAFLTVSKASTFKSLLSSASFSANSLLPGFDAIKIDASQPCTHPFKSYHTPKEEKNSNPLQNSPPNMDEYWHIFSKKNLTSGSTLENKFF